MVLEIIKHKQAQNGAKYSKQFLKTVLDSVSEAISIVDIKDFRIIGANSSFLKLYGVTELQALGKKCYELTHNRITPCEAPDMICPLQEVMAGGKSSITVEHIHYKEKGEKLFEEVSAYPIFDDKGKVVQVVHLSRDITERKNLEGQLNRRIQELQGLNDMFQKHLSVRSETELAYISLATAIGQLYSDINNLLKNAESQDITNQAPLVRGLVGIADEVSKLASQAEAMVSRMNLPPAERL